MKPLPADMESVVRSVIREIVPDKDERGISFIIRPLPTILADPSLIRQVRINLPYNAVKFTSTAEAPMIEVGSKSG